MKKIILFLIALTILFKSEALAVVDLQLLDPDKELIKLITPSPTPTSNLKLFITPRVSLKPLATSTPTNTPTPTATLTPTLTPTANPSVTVAPTQTPAVITSVVTATPTTEQTTPAVKPDNSQMTVWFLLVTIGLLAVIIFVQALPKKDNQDEE